MEQAMTPRERAQRILKEVSGVAAQYNVKSADLQFLRGLLDRAPAGLSPKQEQWMRDIENKVFEDGDED